MQIFSNNHLCTKIKAVNELYIHIALSSDMKIMLSHSIFFQSLPNEPHAWTRTTQYTTQWRPELFWNRNPINFTQKWNLKSAIVWKNIDLIWHRLWKNVAMSCLTSPRPELSAKWILSILSDFTSHQLKSKHFGISLFGERLDLRGLREYILQKVRALGSTFTSAKLT